MTHPKAPVLQGFQSHRDRPRPKGPAAPHPETPDPEPYYLGSLLHLRDLRAHFVQLRVDLVALRGVLRALVVT